jgi:hypothetical protein
MYFCLKCEKYHEASTAATIFKTGFRTVHITKVRVPVGICHKEKGILLK